MRVNLSVGGTDRKKPGTCSFCMNEWQVLSKVVTMEVHVDVYVIASRVGCEEFHTDIYKTELFFTLKLPVHGE